MTTTEQRLDHIQNWRTRLNDMLIEVSHHGVSDYQPNGIWCYYIYIYESKCPRFSELWLPEKLVKITPESEGFISHDYNDTIVSGVDWHGGVTFYAKHGHYEGRRSIQFGCDFSHLWDREREYTLDDVLSEAIETCNQIHRILSA